MGFFVFGGFESASGQQCFDPASQDLPQDRSWHRCGFNGCGDLGHPQLGRLARLRRQVVALDLLGCDRDTLEDEPHALTEMQALCHERGLEFLVLVFPVLSSLDESYPFGHVHEELQTFLDAADIDSVALLEPFKERGAAALRVHITDLHPNEVAHELAAQAVSDHLRKRFRSEQ